MHFISGIDEIFQHESLSMVQKIRRSRIVLNWELMDHGHTKLFSRITRYSCVTHTPLGFDTKA